MAKTVTHTEVAAGANDPTAEVSKDAWNAAHTVTIDNLVNADIAAAAAIAESKLALTYATHSNTNDPTADEKDAMDNAPTAADAANPFVTVADLPAISPVYTIHVGAASFAPLDLTTYYFGNLEMQAAATTSTNRRVVVRKDGTITMAEITWLANTVVGTNESVSLYIRLNDTTDTLIATVGNTDAIKYFSNTSLGVAVTAGDFFEIKLSSPTWATNPTGVVFSGNVYLEQ